MPCVCNAIVLRYAKGGEIMSDDELYKQMYYKLFNAVTDAISLIETEPTKAKNILISVQQETEEIFISQP